MKSLNYIPFVLIFVFIFASCEKVVNLDLPAYSSKVVVNGEFNTNSTIKLEISRSIPILNVADSTGYLLQDASAKLYENNIFIGNLTFFNGFYTLNYKPVQGKKYKVDITRKDFPSAYADIEIPANIVSNAVFKDSVSFDKTGYPVGQITLNFKDNVATNNYYEILIRYYAASIQQWFPLEIASNDIVFANNEKLDNGAYVFSDVSFNGQNKTLDIPVGFGTATGTPKFEVSIKTFSEDYYRYLKQVRDYNKSSGLFVSDPVILRSNVNNGLGMVGGVFNAKDTIR